MSASSSHNKVWNSRQCLHVTAHALMLLVVVLNSLFAVIPASAYEGLENDYTQRTSSSPVQFLHPSLNIGTRPATDQSITTAQDYGALLQCVDSYCSDPNPCIFLTEEFETSIDTRKLNFKILCTGTGCTKKNDVYYRIVYQVEW
ncbi:MAG: hypothetical protein LC130_06225, partial [Bryobacterales bacterium]|nr:hypothetical protein [Bryobacterales bacterium]